MNLEVGAGLYLLESRGLRAVHVCPDSSSTQDMEKVAEAPPQARHHVVLSRNTQRTRHLPSKLMVWDLGDRRDLYK